MTAFAIISVKRFISFAKAVKYAISVWKQIMACAANFTLGHNDKETTILFGSSNISYAGLMENIELNTIETVPYDSKRAALFREWFENLFKIADEIDEELLQKIIKEGNIMRIGFGLILTCLVLGLAISSASALLLDFSDGKLEGNGWKWTPNQGVWKIKDGELVQTDMADNIFLIYSSKKYKTEEWKDYVTVAQVYPLSGDYISLNVRCNGPDSGSPFISWLVHTAAAKGAKGYSKIWGEGGGGGEWKDAGAEGDQLLMEQWNEMKIEVNGDHITCYLNGVKQKDFKDNGRVGRFGGIGVGTYACQAKFDNIRVNGPGIPLDSDLGVASVDKLAITWGKIKTLDQKAQK